MRILVVVHGWPPATQGGSEIHAWELARAMAESHGDEVLVITREADASAPEYRIREERRDGLAILWINNTFRAARSFEEGYRNETIADVAERAIEAFGPDVAHIHHLTCLSTSIVSRLRARGVPCVLTLHDYWFICHRGQLLDVKLNVCAGPEPDGCDGCLGFAASAAAAMPGVRAGWRAVAGLLPASTRARLHRGLGGRDGSRRRMAHMREVCASLSHLLAPSEAMRDRFVQFGIPAGRIAVSPYGTDVDRFAPAGPTDRGPAAHGAALNRGESTTRRPQLGFLGSLMISKGLHVLLEAFAGLPPHTADLHVYGAHVPYHGDGSYRELLAPLLRAPGVQVHGPVAHDRVPDVLASFDALVVPSIWPENSPLVIREAFAAGVPVVAARTGGIPETVVEGRGGRLFHPGDAGDLTRVLRELLLPSPDPLHALRAHIPPVRRLDDEVAELRALFRRPPPSPLAAIVLNYRTPDDTLLAVRSLLASDRAVDRLIVVDNDQGPECLAALQGVAAHLQYVQLPANSGFPAGMNAGIQVALKGGAERLLIVNSDALLPPDAIGELERVMHASRAGIVAPMVLQRSAPDRMGTAGISYDRRTGRMRHPGAGGSRPAHARAIAEVDAVSGCLMLVDRAVFDTVGLFDAAYFFGFEDIDLCLRARAAGFQVAVAGRAVVYHEGGRSIGAQSPERLYYAARNHLRLNAAPHSGAANTAGAAASAGPAGGAGGLWSARTARTARAFSIVALNVAHAVRSRGAPLPTRLAAVARGVRDHLHGRYGPAR